MGGGNTLTFIVSEQFLIKKKIYKKSIESEVGLLKRLPFILSAVISARNNLDFFNHASIRNNGGLKL